MTNLDGMKMKFTIVKNQDLETYLTDNERNSFYYLVEDKIEYTKLLEGEKKNTYLVINTDEPYVDEIIGIMKRHGHWG